MRRLLPFLLLLTGCPQNVTAPSAPVAPSLTWTSNGNPDLPYCSPTVTRGCLLTYTIKMDGAVVAIDIPGSSLSYTLSTLPPSGTHTYELIINGADQSGATINSGPATTTVVIP